MVICCPVANHHIRLVVSLSRLEERCKEGKEQSKQEARRKKGARRRGAGEQEHQVGKQYYMVLNTNGKRSYIPALSYTIALCSLGRRGPVAELLHLRLAVEGERHEPIRVPVLGVIELLALHTALLLEHIKSSL